MDIKVVLIILSIYLVASAVIIYLVWHAKSKSAKAMLICYGAFVLLVMGVFIISTLDLLVGSPLILKIYLDVTAASFVAGLIFSCFVKLKWF